MSNTIQLRGVVMEDICNYSKTSLYLITSYCSFKCDKEAGCTICQNSSLVTDTQVKEYKIESIYNAYINNPLTHAIVIGGLEPFMQFDEIKSLIDYFRWNNCFDPIVIYTGYYPDELAEQLSSLQKYANIIIKFGRYIPNQNPHFDEVLGIELASDNQFAEVIS